MARATPLASFPCVPNFNTILSLPRILETLNKRHSKALFGSASSFNFCSQKLKSQPKAFIWATRFSKSQLLRSSFFTAGEGLLSPAVGGNFQRNLPALPPVMKKKRFVLFVLFPISSFRTTPTLPFANGDTEAELGLPALLLTDAARSPGPLGPSPLGARRPCPSPSELRWVTRPACL